MQACERFNVGARVAEGELVRLVGDAAQDGVRQAGRLRGDRLHQLDALAHRSMRLLLQEDDLVGRDAQRIAHVVVDVADAVKATVDDVVERAIRAHHAEREACRERAVLAGHAGGIDVLVDKLLGEGIALADDRRHAQSRLTSRGGTALGIFVDNAARARLVAEGMLRATALAALGAVAVLELTVLVELKLAAIDAFLRLATLGEGSVLLVGTPRPAALEASMLACVLAREAAIVRTIFLEGGVAARSAVEIARCAFALFEGLAVAIVLIEWLTLAIALLEFAIIVTFAVRLAVAFPLFECALAVAPAIVVALAIGLSVVIALAVGLAVAVPLLREGLPARATIIASLTVGFTIVRALVVEGLARAMLAIARGTAARVALTIAALAALAAVARALIRAPVVAASLRAV